MRVVTINRAHNLTRLHNEILAGIPSLAPEMVDGALRSRFMISGDGSTLTLQVPDNFNDALLTPILTAHNPAPTPPIPKIDLGNDVPADQAEKMAEAAATLRQYLGVASPTAAQSAAALKLLIRVVLYVLKNQLGY